MSAKLDTPSLSSLDPEPTLPAYAADAILKGWMMKKASKFPYGWHRRYMAFLGPSKVRAQATRMRSAASDHAVLPSTTHVRTTRAREPRG